MEVQTKNSPIWVRFMSTIAHSSIWRCSMSQPQNWWFALCKQQLKKEVRLMLKCLLPSHFNSVQLTSLIRSKCFHKKENNNRSKIWSSCPQAVAKLVRGLCCVGGSAWVWVPRSKKKNKKKKYTTAKPQCRMRELHWNKSVDENKRTNYNILEAQYMCKLKVAQVNSSHPAATCWYYSDALEGGLLLKEVSYLSVSDCNITVQTENLKRY